MPGNSVSCDSSFRSRLQRISSLTPRSAAPPGPAMRFHSPSVDGFPVADSVVIRSPSYWIRSARNAPVSLSHYSRTAKPCRAMLPANFGRAEASLSSIRAVAIRRRFRPDLLNLDQLRQELVEAADQLQTALRFDAHFQELLQNVEFERKLAGNSIGEQAV